jgi:hypothetical protein
VTTRQAQAVSPKTPAEIAAIWYPDLTADAEGILRNAEGSIGRPFYHERAFVTKHLDTIAFVPAVITRFDWTIFSQCNFPEYHKAHPVTVPKITYPVYQVIFDKRSSYDRKRFNDEGIHHLVAFYYI